MQQLTEVSKGPSQMVSGCPEDVQIIRAATEVYYEEKKMFQGKCEAKTL